MGQPTDMAGAIIGGGIAVGPRSGAFSGKQVAQFAARFGPDGFDEELERQPGWRSRSSQRNLE